MCTSVKGLSSASAVQLLWGDVGRFVRGVEEHELLEWEISQVVSQKWQQSEINGPGIPNSSAAHQLIRATLIQHRA